jgi:hypothetical protein
LQQFKGPSQSQQTIPKQSSEPRKLLALQCRLFLEDETVVLEQGQGEIQMIYLEHSWNIGYGSVCIV